MNHRAPKHPAKEWVDNHANLIVYTAIILVIVLAFVLNGINYREDARKAAERDYRDLKERCLAGVDNRLVQRAQVEAIYNLATFAVKRDAGDPPLTETDRQNYNRFLRQANAFRTNMYKLIKPSDQCAPFVKDNNVKPQTPPVAPLTRPEAKNP